MGTAHKKIEKFSYRDYLNWNDNKRWELIDGVAYDMTPAPSFRHQRVVGNLFRIIADGLDGKPCVAGIAPTDVILSDSDVVQPDIFIVCDSRKITEEVIKGAPDMIVEVLSPATSLKDRREKKQLYEWAGVKEYLLVDPDGRFVERFFLQDDGTFSKSEIFGADEVVTLTSLPDMTIDLAAVFKK